MLCSFDYERLTLEGCNLVQAISLILQRKEVQGLGEFRKCTIDAVLVHRAYTFPVKEVVSGHLYRLLEALSD